MAGAKGISTPIPVRGFNNFPQGHLNDVFTPFFGTNQGFSGVLDGATGEILFVPSVSVGINDFPPPGFVRRTGGHGAVSDLLGGNRNDHRGFTAILQPDNTVKITWMSGTLNGLNANGTARSVPISLRRGIVQAIEYQTGLRVSSF